MCTILDFKTGKQITQTMTVERAEFVVGAGLMLDELESVREICSDDPNIVEACDVIIAVRHSKQ